MVDVVLLRLRIRSGMPRLFAEAFLRILLVEQFVMRRGGPFGRALRRWLNVQLEPILVEEGMYTESIFLDREDGEPVLLWYMEAESMEGVYDGFLESNHAMTDAAGRVGGWLFEEPERVLSRNVDSDYPLLAHVWNPDRP